MVAFDCHAHVYERVAPVGRPRYTPAGPAPLGSWLRRLAEHGLKGGVIVQVSFHGGDNAQLLEALSQVDRRRFAGVAVVGERVSDPDLGRLVDGGVRGVRWNLVAGASLPDPDAPNVRRHLFRLRDHGLHLELQLESRRLASLLPRLAKAAGTLVVDHVGLPEAPDPTKEPWLDALERLEDRRGVHVKLSAPYRSVVDPRPHIRRLTHLLPPDQMIWGSDWPHTRHEDVATFAALKEEVAGLIDDRTAAARLYDLTVGVSTGSSS